MNIKTIIITIIALTVPITQEATILTLYKETEHFQIFCTSSDQAVSDEILKQHEKFFIQLSHDFQHHYSSKIILKIYPDLTSFHQAINWSTAPDWIVGETENHTDMRVSPLNPGSYHSYDSIMHAGKVGLVTLFISDKYHNHQAIPRWLHQGVALYKGNLISRRKLNELAKNPSQLPTLEQLEQINKNDTLSFDMLHGFQVSYSLIEFIVTKWGWNNVLTLLEDYASLEKILNVSKQELRKRWIRFLVCQTENKQAKCRIDHDEI